MVPALLKLVYTVIYLYIWCLIVYAVLSWLIAFNVINTRNQFVHMVSDFLFRITEPVLRPIRKVIPLVSGIDLSPVVLILGLQTILWIIEYEFLYPVRAIVLP